MALTHYLDDDAAADGDDVYGLLKRYTDVLAPGGFPVLSQVTPDLNPEAVGKAAQLFARGGTPFQPRPLTAFARFFDGLELLGPGIVPVTGRDRTRRTWRS
ncbi:SAM-dependent methyltransferase [Streptomyces violaceorubidus]|uniref:SAM-dependent methyltransferase n=1 Tax=Streptomyces violaceorubidus TaxID=284042 RepID=UPI003D9EA57A